MSARSPFSGLPPEVTDVATEVGIDVGSEARTATVAIVDDAVAAAEVRRGLTDAIELVPVSRALERPEVAELSWSVLDPGRDEVVEEARRAPTGGFFLRVRSGHRIAMPVQACLLLAATGSHQVLHNIIVVEDDAELSLITGCGAPSSVRHGVHVGVTEVVLGHGATLTDTMIHRWAPDARVRPRTGLRASADATYVGNYVLLSPPGSLDSRTAVLLAGDDSRAETRSIIVGAGRAVVGVDTEIHLAGARTSAESIARAIARDRSDIVLRAELIGRHDESQGRLDCRGLLQSPSARITATPTLRADRAPGSQLAHEATIGPISEEAIEYLMTRGLGRDDATAAVTRGFLEAGVPELSPDLERRVRELSAKVAVGSL